MLAYLVLAYVDVAFQTFDLIVWFFSSQFAFAVQNLWLGVIILVTYP
jgi:hypothetical protein